MKKILLFVFLAGCGFRPVFSDNDTDIYVPPISGINGIELRNALNAKFGGQRQPTAKYELTITLREPSVAYKALERSGVATWQEVSVGASYTLKADNQVIATGNETAAESYTFVRYLVASNASYNNAVNNTIAVLAEKIGNRAIATAYDYENNHTTDAK